MEFLNDIGCFVIKHDVIVRGWALIFVAGSGLWLTSRRLALADANHLADTYTRAAQQIGEAEQAVQLAGLYALGELAGKNKDYHWKIMKVLCAFVRGVKTREVTQAALTIIGEREVAFDRKQDTENGTVVTLAQIDFQEAYLEGANFHKADLTSAVLTEVDLARADLREADLSNATLEWAKLEWADLTGAKLIGANLANTKLKKAKLKGALLNMAILRGADLSGSDLTNAKLNKAKLNWADLTEAKLIGANLTGANLDGADLTGASITQEQFDSALTDKDTKAPEGVINPEASTEPPA